LKLNCWNDSIRWSVSSALLWLLITSFLQRRRKYDASCNGPADLWHDVIHLKSIRVWSIGQLGNQHLTWTGFGFPSLIALLHGFGVRSIRVRLQQVRTPWAAPWRRATWSSFQLEPPYLVSQLPGEFLKPQQLLIMVHYAHYALVALTSPLLQRSVSICLLSLSIMDHLRKKINGGLFKMAT